MVAFAINVAPSMIFKSTLHVRESDENNNEILCIF